MIHDGIQGYPIYHVTDAKVLQALCKVPRHRFVPEEYRDLAYRNSPLYNGYNQTVSQSHIVAHMSKLLRLKPEHRVLEIGTVRSPVPG